MSVAPLPQFAGPLSASAVVARVHDLLDLVADDVGVVSGADVAAAERAVSRLEALKLRLVAAAERQGAAEGSGMTGTSAWLAAHTRAWGAKAAGDVVLAVALEESLPVTRAALAAGSVSPAHAAVIAGTTSRLPARLGHAERAAIEASLVAQARRVDPARLRRAARRALAAAERSAEEVAAHEDAELRSEEDRARLRVRLTLHDNRDGTVSGHFTVPTLAGQILRQAIQQMVAPRRRSRAAPQSGSTPGPGAEPGSGATLSFGAAAESGPSSTDEGAADWAHRHGEAFVALLEHLPTDRLGGKVAATVVVTVDHDALRARLGAARVDTGHDLSAGEVRRLACGAGILPAVLGGGSLPLDLGRTKRFFTEAQRVALATVYEECAVEGCDRPYSWCELHHEDPWSRRGDTNLDLAVPACRRNHGYLHDPRFAHTVTTLESGRKVVRLRRRC